MSIRMPSFPARYLNQSDPKELAKHVMEDERPEFFQEVKKGDILLAEKNFGCGSSREHAPLALKTAGISCIIAKSFARIFYRNGLNLGLPLLESPEASEAIQEGDRVRVNLTTGEIFDLTQKRKFSCKTHPGFYAGFDQGWRIDPASSEKRKAGKDLRRWFQPVELISVFYTCFYELDKIDLICNFSMQKLAEWCIFK